MKTCQLLTNISDEVDRPIKQLFEGKHSLQRLVQFTSQEGKLSGSGFFLLGSGIMEIKGKTQTKQFVKFAWESTDKTFIISSISLEKVRIRLDNNIEIPTAEFQLRCDNNNNIYSCGDYELQNHGSQKVIDNGWVLSVTFTVKPNDWPPKLQMPL